MSRNKRVKGVLSVPGDKSISHRALIFSALSRGTVTINGLSPAEDCRSTAECLRQLGLKITQGKGRGGAVTAPGFAVESPGFDQLSAPAGVLFAGNSGTTMRLLSGLLAGRPFESKFDGDESLRMRPMARVLTPLCEMGAKVSYEVVENAEKSNDSSSCAPFSLLGGELTGKSFDLKVASAQVQTALLLAGLQAKGKTSVNSNSTVRDHTERMFRHIGIPVEKNGDGRLEVSALSEPVAPFTISVPGDLSSAAFFIVAAACLPGSDLLIKNVNINQGRRLVIEVLKQMGSEIVLESETEISGEPVADIRVRYNGRLKGATISGDVIASGIDEIPILALAGCTCDGQFVVRGAGELRVKESDRLSAIIENVKAMGVEIEGAEDGFTITGAASIPGNSLWRTYSDHRLAMTGLIASYVCEEPLTVEETNSIKVSYPGFEQQLKLLITT